MDTVEPKMLGERPGREGTLLDAEDQRRTGRPGAGQGAAAPASRRIPVLDRPPQGIAFGPDHRCPEERHDLALQLSGAAPRCTGPARQGEPLLRPSLCPRQQVVSRTLPVCPSIAPRRAHAGCFAVLPDAPARPAAGSRARAAGQARRVAAASHRPGVLALSACGAAGGSRSRSRRRSRGNRSGWRARRSGSEASPTTRAIVTATTPTSAAVPTSNSSAARPSTFPARSSWSSGASGCSAIPPSSRRKSMPFSGSGRIVEAVRAFPAGGLQPGRSTGAEGRARPAFRAVEPGTV